MVSRILRRTKQLLLVSLLFISLYSAHKLYSSLNEIKEIHTVNNGIQTCFFRANQSYIASVMGQPKGSQYLNPGFWGLTEECFSDVIYRAEKTLGEKISLFAGKLNFLTKEIFWFHESLKDKKQKGLKPTGNITLKKRFQKIEGLGQKIYEIILFIGFLVGMRKTERVDQIERSAEDFEGLVKNQRDVKVESIITEALSVSKMPQVSHLFANYSKKNFQSRFNYPNWNGENFPELKAPEIGSIPAVVSLGETFSRVLDLYMAKIFTKGIYLDLRLSDNLHPLVPMEMLEQLLYSLFSFSINNISKSNNKDKKILLKARQLKNEVLMEFSNNGPLFNLKKLKSIEKKQIQKSFEDISIYRDLKIVLRLAKDCDANVTFENIQGRPVVKIMMKSRPKTNFAVKSVEFGPRKKSDLALSI
jgi:hypothetical protein